MQKISILLFFIVLFAKGNAQNLMPVDEGSAIKFTIKNFGFSIGGSFTGLKGSILFDEANIGAAKFTVTINAASVNTGNTTRDKHLRKEDYFDVQKFPLLSFTSTGLGKGDKAGLYLMKGWLSIKGRTKEISFPFTSTSQNGGYLFSGSFNINRRDYDVGGSSMVLADNLQVSLKVFAKKN